MKASGAPIEAVNAPTAKMTIKSPVAIWAPRVIATSAASRACGVTGVVNIRRHTPRSR